MTEYYSPGISDTEISTEEDPIAKWSVKADRPTAAPSQVKKIHIYDFDNTIFKSPAPNPNLWDNDTLAMLKEPRLINNNSWWQFPEFLKQSGTGYEVERVNGWNGLWIEHVVALARQSCSNPSVLTILMTGRKANSFQNLVLEMLEAKGLNFDCVILKKGAQRNTIKYKLELISDFIATYRDIDELVIYDDRPHQLKSMREYLQMTRKRFRYTLKLVKPQISLLAPDIEVAIVQKLIASHNHNHQEGKVKNLGLLKLYKAQKYSIRRDVDTVLN